MFSVSSKPPGLLPAESCLPGRSAPHPDIAAPDAKHFVKGTPLHGPFPDNLETIILGVGCSMTVASTGEQ